MNFYPSNVRKILNLIGNLGSIGITKNKSEESSHFCLHVINIHPSNVKPEPVKKQKGTVHAPVALLADTASIHSGSRASVSSIASSASFSANGNSTIHSEESRKKQEESERYAREQQASDNQQMPSSSVQASAPADPTPPTYGNLFPTLPS